MLLQLGFRKERQKGSHVFYRHPDGRTTTLPNHPGRASTTRTRPPCRTTMSGARCPRERYRPPPRGATPRRTGARRRDSAADPPGAASGARRRPLVRAGAPPGPPGPRPSDPSRRPTSGRDRGAPRSSGLPAAVWDRHPGPGTGRAACSSGHAPTIRKGIGPKGCGP